MKKTITIRSADIIAYVKLRKKGYKTLWTGEGQICMKKQVVKCPKCGARMRKMDLQRLDSGLMCPKCNHQTFP